MNDTTTTTDILSGLSANVNVKVTIDYTTAAILGVTLFTAAFLALALTNLLFKNK